MGTGKSKRAWVNCCYLSQEVEAQEEKEGYFLDSGGDLAKAINQVDQFLRDTLPLFPNCLFYFSFIFFEIEM
jgi:hypothetical protein